MAEGLARKKRIRGGHRASATRVMTQATGAMAAPDADPGMAELMKLKLTLEEKFATLTRLDEEILDLVEEDEVDGEIEQADVLKESIRLVLVNLDSAVRPPTGGPGASVPMMHPTAPPRGHATKVRLPKITLKRFNGDLTRWTTFWDSFESSIHENPDLSDVDKFNYLYSLLEGPASGAISGLKLTSANYAEAVEILKKRFGRKQQIIAAHMDVLLNLDAVSSQFNLMGLRHLYDLIETQVRSLKSLGVPPESYGTLLSSVLVNKLPQELRLIVSREVPDSDWDLDRLMKVLEGEIEARERASTTSGSSGPTHTPRKHIKDLPTATALTSVTADPKCSYCGQPHSSSGCESVTDPEGRKKILMKAGRCFVCLRKYHLSRDCRSTMKCPNCNGRHHVSICMKSQARSSRNMSAEGNSNPIGPPSPTDTPTTAVMHNVNANMPVLLQTARAHVYNVDDPQSTKEVRILLDSGSQRSYVAERIQKTLSLSIESVKTMLIKTFGSDQENRQACGVVHLGMALKDGRHLEMSLFTVPMICEPLSAQPIAHAREGYQHLADLGFADFSHGDEDLEVDILIGSDHYWKLVTGETIRGSSGPTAIQTRLGWVLSGPVEGLSQTHAVNLVSTHTLRTDAQAALDRKQDLDESLKRFWDLETLGIREDENSVYEEFEKSVTSRDGRYEVQLPWKEPHPVLPDNYNLSQKRLTGLLRRLRQNPKVLREYDAVIRDQLNRGIVEIVRQPEASDDREVHYIPHHAVVREDKTTTKLRIVYDASAKTNGPSLNDCLYTGPKFGQSIQDIILRFRTHRIALAADIEKAFLMISILEHDRDALRFLWIDDIGKDPPETVIMRFARVVFGVSSSPFLLNATIRHHLERYRDRYPAFVEAFLRSIYVDDVSFGSDDEDGAFHLYERSKNVLAEGGFNLRKFVTNSRGLRERIKQNEQSFTPVEEAKVEASTSVKEEDASYAKDTLGDAQECQGELKILGVKWNFTEDLLVFDLSTIAALLRDLVPTKRHIVGVTTKFYDPLGFVSPVTIRFKMLFQELCVSKIEWDEPLSGDLLREWNALISNFQGMSISIPRCYFHFLDRSPSTCSLQGFCDASTGAYAAVVYIKIEAECGSSVKFVASKTRVSPVGKQTIPRLELLSALLLAKLITSVSAALEPQITLSGTACFTDSKVALYWIRGTDKEWKPFVQNRVNEIRGLLPFDCWRHCPGKENPADIPSRGVTPLELSISTLWHHGPTWLTDPVLDDEEEVLSMPEESLEEMKVKDRKLIHTMLVTDGSNHGLGQVVSCKDFSSLQRLLRVTARVLKFIDVLKCRIKRLKEPPSLELSADDLMRAEVMWMKEAQRTLSEEKRFDVWKKQFDLFLDDDGLFRCRGRLGNADVPLYTRHPILLPKCHHLAVLVVRNAHERVMHNGVKETLVEVRARYWIVKGRQFVRQLLHGCVLCRKFDGVPYHAPPSPPLPEFRVNPEPPFTYTGVDFAGPLYIKAAPSMSSNKVWICLYTCCVVRAVHLEIVPDMSAETFIRSFKRFTARRGFPRKMISDNAKSFKSAAKTIKAVMDHPDVQRHFAGIRVEWLFNVEKAPWTGGIFERMVRSMKRCLKKTIGKAVLTYDELATAITEVEVILNSRPLSYVSTEDIEEPLTPSHLLIGRRALSLPDATLCEEEVDDLDMSHAYLSKRLRYLNKSLDHFWKRWRAEYLLELRECHRYGDRNAGLGTDAIQVGDIVLVHGESRPRAQWRLGKVELLKKGADGHVRSASVRVHSKGTRTILLKRPVKRLYPLEANCSLNNEAGPTDCGSETETQLETGVPRRRSQRAAALSARDRLKALSYV